MDDQYRKWVNLSYLAAAFLFYYIVFSFSVKVSTSLNLETHIRNADLVFRLFSIASGSGLFIYLYRHEAVNQFMGEVILELARVTWPTQKETVSATVIVMIMVLISGVILGILDYVWAALLQQVL
jgi:preprotein translocase subunit SecE